MKQFNLKSLLAIVALSSALCGEAFASGACRPVEVENGVRPDPSEVHSSQFYGYVASKICPSTDAERAANPNGYYQLSMMSMIPSPVTTYDLKLTIKSTETSGENQASLENAIKNFINGNVSGLSLDYFQDSILPTMKEMMRAKKEGNQAEFERLRALGKHDWRAYLIQSARN